MTLSAGRRTLLLATAAGLATSACGTEDSAEGGAASGETITFRHQYGTTKAPVDARRVVTLSPTWADTIAALGVPVYAEFQTADEPYPWTPKHQPHHTAPLTTAAEVSVEKVASYRPDLILAGYLPDARTYRSLSRVAPTIPVLDQSSILDTWQTQLTTAGRIFEKQSKAKQIRDDLDQQTAQFRAKHPTGGTFSFAQLASSGQIGVVTDPADPAAVLISDATGLELDPAVRAESSDGGRVLLSAERLDVLGSDLLLMWAIDGNEKLEALPGWGDLPSVQRGSTVLLDNTSAIAFAQPSQASVPYCLDLLGPAAAAMA